jgi:acetyl-CoA carboxylase carboxyltransferase component
MASAMMSEATPAATPMTEMAVMTPTTACRRLARRYRAAMKSSNRIRT